MNGKTAKLLRKYASVVQTPKKLDGSDLYVRNGDHNGQRQKRYDALKDYWKHQLDRDERAEYRVLIKEGLREQEGVFVPGEPEAATA